MFFPFVFLLVLLFFSGAQNPLFLPRMPHDFLLKLICKKSIFWAVSGGTPFCPLFFFLLSIFSFVYSFSFSFSISFPVFLFFFLCCSCFHYFFIYFPFVFLLKMFFSFFILFLFFLFSGAQNLWRHSWIPWGKVHILSWVYLLCIGSSSLFPVE